MSTTQATATVSQASAETGATVLIIEDDEDLAAILAENLSSCGHHVSIARNASEAERKLLDASVDVVVTDFSMPGGDGLALIRRVREDANLAHVAIVLTSGHPDTARFEREALTLRAAFVPKPYDLGALLRAVERARGLLPPTSQLAA